MKAKLERISNSCGVRIPKPLIEQCGLGDTVELRIENDRLVISSERTPRQGWRKAFRAAGPAINDELLLEVGQSNEFDREEWQW